MVFVNLTTPDHDLLSRVASCCEQKLHDPSCTKMMHDGYIEPDTEYFTRTVLMEKDYELI